MAPVHSQLCRATNVNWQHFLPQAGLEKLGTKLPGDLASSNPLPEKMGHKGTGRACNEEKYLEVYIDKANEILGMDNFRLHPFCVSAYYPGESDEVIHARKTTMVPAKKTAPGSRREDVFFFETIRVPYNPRQQLLHVEIFEVQVPLQMQFEDEWVGRATVQLADPKVEELAEYELARGPFEYGGTVTVSVKLPPPEVEAHAAHPLPDLRTFPKPVSPRQHLKSKMKVDAGGIDMSPFDIPREGASSTTSGKGESDTTPEPRTRSGSSFEGKSPPKPIWMPVINGPGGSCFGLTDQIEKMVTFQPKVPEGPSGAQDVKVGSMRLIAQMPELATVSPGVAAMVAQAVLAMPVRCGRTSMVPPRCGGPWIPSPFAPVSVAPAYGRNLCRVAC